MIHVLDNPIWSALTSGNSNLSNGNNEIKYFDIEVSPFVGLKENSSQNLKLLYEQVQHTEPIIFVATEEMEIPGQWKVLQCIKSFQMINDSPVTIITNGPQLVPLTVADVPQMLALTKLTVPGPFAPEDYRVWSLLWNI